MIVVEWKLTTHGFLCQEPWLDVSPYPSGFTCRPGCNDIKWYNLICFDKKNNTESLWNIQTRIAVTSNVQLIKRQCHKLCPSTSVSRKAHPGLSNMYNNGPGKNREVIDFVYLRQSEHPRPKQQTGNKSQRSGFNLARPQFSTRWVCSYDKGQDINSHGIKTYQLIVNSIKTTSMEDVSTRVLEKIMRIFKNVKPKNDLRFRS